MNNKFLETKNITKTFGKLKALDDVNFNLYRGKIHGLLGENGAGKSSLMNVLSGIYKPEKGIIYLDGQRQNISSPDIASQLGIGMVHQEFRLVESFSIKDNLTLSKSNIFKDNFFKSFKKYSEIFALNANENEIISDLSVGEKQKIEIMKLIFNDSNIMLLDEPTAVLTPQETSQLKNSLITLAEEDMKTIVLITHKLKEIKEYLIKIINSSIKTKSIVVSQDEHENGVRAILNYGHSFGHVIENLCGYGKFLHGEAISIGMNIAGKIAIEKGLWSKEELERQQILLESYDLPTEIPKINKEDVLTILMGDKKVRDGKMRFILPKEIGAVDIYDDVEDSFFLKFFS